MRLVNRYLQVLINSLPQYSIAPSVATGSLSHDFLFEPLDYLLVGPNRDVITASDTVGNYLLELLFHSHPAYSVPTALKNSPPSWLSPQCHVERDHIPYLFHRPGCLGRDGPTVVVTLVVEQLVEVDCG